ncbi:uncharacterized protein B0I36DRAFT_312749 [Microdochium trichocladiopsis]|uniref:NmrA-like domain-containing protein n=1 Tax=Microdochium trichocladiopsis TaxID=1682393 RepID=A0A9P8YJY1_9PEZI|nr:uncharacterized protein B0I36DRAFT_312749 [Microdochium trichocladiopsis]KAH7041393.1 hypothetical protein B0I36DRAFT_312749 [Microdochium trichocladiopsis]
MTPAPVIVIGATGDVGSAAARFAEQHGSSVVLAVRDLEKPVPGLSAAAEKAGRYERVQIDLFRPDTIEAAVRTTGAKRAFLYATLGSQDIVPDIIGALKAGGVEFVVFLSTVSIATAGDDLSQVGPEKYIPWLHAQYEIQLEKTFGKQGYVALRAGFFSSNMRWYYGGIAKGEVRVAYPDALLELCTPEDLGRVAASFLSQKPETVTDEPAIVLSGPEPVTLRHALEIIGTVLGRPIRVVRVDQEENVQEMKQMLGDATARTLVQEFVERETAGDDVKRIIEEGAVNMRKYAHGGQNMEKWAQENKDSIIAALSGSG